MHYWPLQDAKSQLSKLVKCTLHEGPQGISVHGKQQVVILSKNLYDTLVGNQYPFLDLMQNSPLHGLDLDFERNRSKTRDIDV